jgi:hypothetical protein
LAGVWRTLERQRGQEQLGLEEIAQRKAELQAEVAELEKVREAIKQTNEELWVEQEKIEETWAALEERASETRRQLESEAGLCAFLRDVGSDRIAAAAERLGWFEDADV